jgi:zinc protease
MLDEGTQTRHAPQIADELAQLGAGLGAGSATDTSSVAAFSLKKHLPAALDILADVVLRPSFPAAEIERQRASRLAALAQQRDDAGTIAAKTVAAVLYGERHPYGHLELGTEASVKSMTREAMVAFWQQNFVPNNAALVVAGDITMKELRAIAEKAFGGWKPGTPARPALPTPSTAPARLVIVDRPGAPQTELRVAAIGAARATPDYYALEVMNSALGGQFTSRLNQNLREVHGYSYGAGSGFDFRKTPGPFVVLSAVQTGATAPAVIEVFRELRAIAQSPIPPEELQRSKDALSRSLSAVFQTSASEAGVSSGLYIYDLGLDYFTHVAGRVNAVTAQQTLAAAQKYLVPEKMTVVAVGDRKKIEAELRKLRLGATEIRDAEGRPAK